MARCCCPPVSFVFESNGDLSGHAAVDDGLSDRAGSEPFAVCGAQAAKDIWLRDNGRVAFLR
ncbi:hypothetical protein C2W62_09420 [Candidatus Entotheonella serta]|nr:hypothetical protein C2W62_09420 [Candidatus Entotheonella serta]